MKDFLNKIFFDNTVLSYLEVLGTVVIVLFIKRLISKYLAGLLFRAFADKGKELRRNSFVELIIKPLEVFLIVLVIIIAFDKLTFPAALDFTLYKVKSRDLIDGVAHAALIITFIRLCIKVVQFAAMILEEKAIATADQTDNQLVIFFKDFFRVVLNLLAILLILRFVFGYDISKLITGLSIVGAAIALATKESLENLIASFIIFFDRPFTTGDTVKVQNFTGTVEKIGLRSTRIRTEQKTFITVPNKQMVDSILDNISLRTQRRADLSIEISLSTSASEIKKIIPSIKKILQKETIEDSVVFFSATGKNAHIITVEFYCGMEQSAQAFNETREQVNLEIVELLEKNNIELSGNKPLVIATQE